MRKPGFLVSDIFNNQLHHMVIDASHPVTSTAATQTLLCDQRTALAAPDAAVPADSAAPAAVPTTGGGAGGGGDGGGSNSRGVLVGRLAYAALSRRNVKVPCCSPHAACI